MGHFLNKALKDFANRFALLRGHRVHYVSGWDCHGLPIELKALADSPSPSSLAPLDVRHKARAFALSAIADQKAELARWGLLTDLTLSYLTMSPAYEAEQLSVFLSMLQRGLIYRALKPVYWSPATRTALAEAELEYRDDHTSPSVWVGFPVRGDWAERWPGLQVAVWTTTPWTLPGNVAVAYHPDVSYSVVRVAALIPGHTGKGAQAEAGVEGRHLLIGLDRIAALGDLLQREVVEVAAVATSAFAALDVRHPFLDRASPLIPAAHVTTDAGTAFVHTAPAHGADDFAVCRERGIDEIRGLVDEEGRFSAAAPPSLAGLYVLKEGNAAVVSLLRQAAALLALQPVTHRFPYDWRSKTPVIVRATEQWFTQLDALQADALRALDAVHFHPESGRGRLRAMLAGRREWCLSRQRVWGVPLPVFYRDDGAVLLDEDSVRHVLDLVRREGQRRLVAALGGGAPPPQIPRRRRPLPQGAGHHGRVVRQRLLVAPGPAGGGAGDGARGGAVRRVPGGERPAPGVVPVVAADGSGGERAGAVQGHRHPRLRAGRGGQEDEQIHRQRHRAPGVHPHR